MNQNITLTLHARERLFQRSSETLDSLAQIIRDRKYIPIGHEAGTNREHLLLYSPEDRIWHVIVIDVKTGQIITILPVDFHENISWKVSPGALQEAKLLVEGTEGKDDLSSAASAVTSQALVASKNQQAKPTPVATTPSVIRITGVYFQNWDNRKVMNLGTWPFNHKLQLNEFVADTEFWEAIEGRIRAKEQSVANIEGIFIGRKKGGDIWVEIETPKQWAYGQQVSCASRVQRLQHLRDFVHTWLQRELEPSDGVAVPEDLRLPTALREIYQAVGSVPAFTSPHNQLRPPHEIEVVGDYHIFYDENQRVVRWAFRTVDAEAEDPIVWQGVSQTDGYDWYSEDMPFSAWFQVMTLWQLVNGGYKFGAYAGGIPDATQVVESHFPLVGGHQDGSTRFYGIPGQLICLAGPAEVPSIWAAGACSDDLAALSSKLGFEWD